jgi:voltage-gated potassium channel
MILQRVKYFLDFIRTFVRHAMYIREVIGSLMALIALAGCAISRIEGLKLGDSLYFAFITALSVGYGDISPKTTLGKLVSVCIGLMGILFVGITAAIATRAMADTVKRHSEATKSHRHSI